MQQKSPKQEIEVKNTFEKEGWYSVQVSSNINKIANVIAIRPVSRCVNPAHYEVKFIKVRTSQAIKEKKIVPQAEEVRFGYVNVEYWYFPVKKIKK